MSKLFKTLLLLLVLAAAAVGVYALARGGKGDEGDAEAGHGREGLDHREGGRRRADPAAAEVPGEVEDLRHRASRAWSRSATRSSPAIRCSRSRPIRRRSRSPRSIAARVGEGLVRPRQVRVRARAGALAETACCRSPSSTSSEKRSSSPRSRSPRPSRSATSPATAGSGPKPSTMESIIRAPAAGTVLTRAVNPGDPSCR